MSEVTLPLRDACTDDDAEEWRVVVGYPKYEVSNHGRVRRRFAVGRWAANHVLRAASAHSGHRYVMLSDQHHVVKKQYVHRLVMAAFNGPPPFEGAFVCHHDDIPTNNHPSNLYWGTHAQNVSDARLNRKTPEVAQQGAQPGEANGSARLTEADVRTIRRYLRLHLCGACIARLFNVKKETIYSIAKGRTWHHLPQEETSQ